MTHRRFEDRRVWESRNADEHRRLARVASLVAPGSSVLDIGCGDGALERYLPQGCVYRGVDPAAAALGLDADARFVTGSAAALPFGGASFDYVIASEVLEHLPDAELAAAVAEMRRVAAKHIIVTVPNRESTRLVAAPCRACGHVYNVYGHVRTYDEAALAAQFAGLEPERMTVFGPSKLVAGETYLALRQGWAGYYAESATSVCPRCGAVGTRKSVRGLRAYALMALRAAVFFRRRRAWILAVFAARGR